jgi:hypothetical protein
LSNPLHKLKEYGIEKENKNVNKDDEDDIELE